MPSRILRIAAVLLLTLTALTPARAQKIPPHKSAIVLFNGHDLSNFDTFIRGKGLNSDPEHIFQVEKGVIHISGDGFGYIITRESYKDFYLRADFKWGEGTFLERKGQARDSGILFNVQGEQKVWPRSVEFQINEGGTGDFWMTDGAALTGSDGKRVTGPEGKAMMIPHINKGKFANVTGVRDPTGELEKPHGEWNRLELVSQGGHIRQYVNGKLANEGSDAFPADGKILFQSEGAEVFFRNMKLYPLR
jgi:hypothetical protein